MAMQLGLDRLGAQAEKLAKLPRPYRMALLPVLAALVVGGYVYLFYLPARQEQLTLSAQERELERKVSEVRAIVANLAAFEAELSELEHKLVLALRQLPDSKELPGLLTDISTLGKDAGLEFKAFRPREEVPRDFYAEVPIEVEFSGGYHDVAHFFDRVSKLPRIVNVSRLEMSILEERLDGTALRVRGEATTFRFLEQASSPAPVQPGGARPPAQGGRS